MSAAASAAAPFTALELEQRRPVWSALSELYLDTDTRPQLPQIAAVLAASGLDVPELNTVWSEEVTPALAFNLTLVAGEWGFFDQDWLERRIVQRRTCRPLIRRWPPLTRLLRRFRVSETQPYVQTALNLRAELLTLPEAERPARVAAWDWLARHYFWPDSPPWEVAPDIPQPAALFGALEPHLRPLLTSGESADHHRLHVLSLLGDAP